MPSSPLDTAAPRRADFLALNHAPDLPNRDRTDAGSAQPNRIVARSFCRLLQAGTFELFIARTGRRCG